MYILGTDLVKECASVCYVSGDDPFVSVKYWYQILEEVHNWIDWEMLQAFFLCNKLLVECNSRIWLSMGVKFKYTQNIVFSKSVSYCECLVLISRP